METTETRTHRLATIYIDGEFTDDEIEKGRQYCFRRFHYPVLRTHEHRITVALEGDELYDGTNTWARWPEHANVLNTVVRAFPNRQVFYDVIGEDTLGQFNMDRMLELWQAWYGPLELVKVTETTEGQTNA